MTAHDLLQGSDKLLLTDAGLETWLIYSKGFDLPYFAAYPLGATDVGRAAITEYFTPVFDLARSHGTGVLLDTATWRANPDWGLALGHDRDHLAQANKDAVAAARTLRKTLGQGLEVLINGQVGPRGDGYDPAFLMTSNAAEDYHAFQIGIFAASGVDVISALTLTNIPEAVGIANATAKVQIPCIISFTLETDGRLPTGETLGEAIAQVDAQAKTKPVFFMINCAHPDHFEHALPEDDALRTRIRGVRANASRMSHAELDCCDTLDSGNPVELGAQYAKLHQLLPDLKVVGGCCGTDHRHLAQICQSLTN